MLISIVLGPTKVGEGIVLVVGVEGNVVDVGGAGYVVAVGNVVDVGGAGYVVAVGSGIVEGLE
jgi:hypothetical protein